jgi:ribosomal protein L18E
LRRLIIRKKSITPDQNGQIWVNIGSKLTKSGKRSQAKICLGDLVKDAERRLVRLEQFWQDVARNSTDPIWDDFTFEIAKSLGRGELQFVVKCSIIRLSY